MGEGSIPVWVKVRDPPGYGERVLPHPPQAIVNINRYWGKGNMLIYSIKSAQVIHIIPRAPLSAKIRVKVRAVSCNSQAH